MCVCGQCQAHAAARTHTCEHSHEHSHVSTHVSSTDTRTCEHAWEHTWTMVWWGTYFPCTCIQYEMVLWGTCLPCTCVQYEIQPTKLYTHILHIICTYTHMHIHVGWFSFRWFLATKCTNCPCLVPSNCAAWNLNGTGLEFAGRPLLSCTIPAEYQRTTITIPVGIPAGLQELLGNGAGTVRDLEWL